MERYFEAEKTSFNHSKNIPHKYKHYHKFTFVRNPYERFCALYHACVVNDRKPFVPKNVNTPLDYARFYATLTKHGSYPRADLTASQSFWHKGLPINEFIHIEDAEEIMRSRYSHIDKFPHVLKREHPTWKDIKTPEITVYVNFWAGKDFELLGYEREDSDS
jgi:hypothetical protein